MGLLSVDLLITLQILPVFFSNCLFLALYDSVILLKHMVLFLSRSKSGRGEWRRMLTSEGLRCVWNSFLLDAYKQVGTRGWGPAGWGGSAVMDIPVVNGEGKGREGKGTTRLCAVRATSYLMLSLMGEVRAERSSTF